MKIKLLALRLYNHFLFKNKYVCPKCGGHNIAHYTWHNKCQDCGYVERKIQELREKQEK